MAAFVFENGIIPAKELAQLLNAEIDGEGVKLKGIGDCLKVEERVVAVIHERTVPESVIFVDKEENLPFIKAACELQVLKEFEGIDS